MAYKTTITIEFTTRMALYGSEEDAKRETKEMLMEQLRFTSIGTDERSGLFKLEIKEQTVEVL